MKQAFNEYKQLLNKMNELGEKERNEETKWTNDKSSATAAGTEP